MISSGEKVASEEGTTRQPQRRRVGAVFDFRLWGGRKVVFVWQRESAALCQNSKRREYNFAWPCFGRLRRRRLDDAIEPSAIDCFDLIGRLNGLLINGSIIGGQSMVLALGPAPASHDNSLQTEPCIAQ